MKFPDRYSIFGLLPLAVAIALGGTSLSHGQDSQQLRVGASLQQQNVSLNAARGGTTTLADARGENGLAVVFWSHTCPWAGRYEERLLNLAGTFRDQGVGFIAVNPNNPANSPNDSLERMGQHAGERNYSFPYVSDGGRVAKAFGATRTPHVFLFNAENQLVYAGTLDDSPADAARIERSYLRDALQALVSNQNIGTEQTEAFGCTIKW